MDLTQIGTNTLNTKKYHLELTPVGTKMPYPKTPTLPTEFSKRKEKLGKEYAPEDPESDQSLSDSPLSESDSSNDRKYIKSKSKRSNKKKKHRKRKKLES